MKSLEIAPLPPAEVSVRRLFADAASGTRLDERRAALSSEDPAAWDRIDFPLEVALELAAVCNLRCVMCPVPTTARPAELMDEALFRRAITELRSENGFVLLPSGFGETMLHPRFGELLGEAKREGIGPVILLTNGTRMDDRAIDALLRSGIEALVVSIDGVAPETYAAVRVGGDLLEVERNVRRFLERRGAAASPKLVLRIIRMRETAAEIEAFHARWAPLLGGNDEIRINEFNDWAGKVEDRSVGEPPKGAESATEPVAPCRMLWSNLSVHADGKVSACCHDSEDELIVGDLAAGETLRGIWNGGPLARLRAIHREGRIAELPICAACRNRS